MTNNTKNDNVAKVPRKLRNHHVLDELKSYIIENNLRVGDTIPTEQELSKRFQVSRVSVREATKALSLLGFLRSIPRRGTIVNEPDISGVNDLISFHFASSNYAKRELLELRLIIEIGQLKYVMANITEEAYRECMSITQDANVTQVTRKEWLALDMQFHTALLELGGNRAIRSMVTMLRKFFTVAFKNHELADRETVLNEHRMIIQALYDKNLDLAQGLMHQHLDRSLSIEDSANSEHKKSQAPMRQHRANIQDFQQDRSMVAEKK